MSLALNPEQAGRQLHGHDERLQHLELLVADLVKKVSYSWPYDPDVWGSLIGSASTIDQLKSRIEDLEQQQRTLRAGILDLLRRIATQANHGMSAN